MPRRSPYRTELSDGASPFFEQRLAGLEDRPRRRPDFPAHVRAEVIAMACELPDKRARRPSRWASDELAREASTCRA
jgi:hypothetical protein